MHYRKRFWGQNEKKNMEKEVKSLNIRWMEKICFERFYTSIRHSFLRILRRLRPRREHCCIWQLINKIWLEAESFATWWESLRDFLYCFRRCTPRRERVEGSCMSRRRRGFLKFECLYFVDLGFFETELHWNFWNFFGKTRKIQKFSESSPLYSIPHLSLHTTGFPVRLLRNGFGLIGWTTDIAEKWVICRKRERESEEIHC